MNKTRILLVLATLALGAWMFSACASSKGHRKPPPKAHGRMY